MLKASRSFTGLTGALFTGVLLVGSMLGSTAVLAATDQDSFGRPVKYLDVGSASTVMYYTGTITCPPGLVCRQITNAQTMQTFNENDRIVINLPARATNSLLCFSFSPYLSYMLTNGTTGNLNQSLSIMTNVYIVSNVLFDPTLINKVTGQPFNGSIALQGLGYYSLYKTIAPSGQDRQTISYSRECVNGMISTRTLQSQYGLTQAQAQNVMQSAMTVRFSDTVNVGITGLVSSGLGVRLFGD